MTTAMKRMFVGAAGCAWLAVAAYGVRSAVVGDGDDDWEVPYLLFTIALMSGSAISAGIARWITLQSQHPWRRRAGLLVSAVGVLATFVAWALPLWMALLGVGFALLAFASTGDQRRPLALLGGAHLLGIVALIASIEAEVGPRDEYGDYPAAAGIALVVTAAAMIGGLVLCRRQLVVPQLDVR